MSNGINAVSADGTASATYPYTRELDYLWMNGLEDLPKKILLYLMDMPLLNYTPQTDNSYPRVRLMKYLYYDAARPLNSPALTTAQKMAIYYDPNNPTTPPDADKGYRIYPLMYIKQSQEKAQTILRCYIGRIYPINTFTAQIQITFELFSNMTYDSNMKTNELSRVLAMEQCLWEALDGVNFAGLGTVTAVRGQDGSYPISDEISNVGRRVNFSLTWADSSQPPHTAAI